MAKVCLRTLLHLPAKDITKAFFISSLDGSETLAEDLCRAQVIGAVEDGELWVAELAEPNAEGKKIVGAATWYGPGKLLKRG